MQIKINIIIIIIKEKNKIIQVYSNKIHHNNIEQKQNYKHFDNHNINKTQYNNNIQQN